MSHNQTSCPQATLWGGKSSFLFFSFLKNVFPTLPLFFPYIPTLRTLVTLAHGDLWLCEPCMEIRRAPFKETYRLESLCPNFYIWSTSNKKSSLESSMEFNSTGQVGKYRGFQGYFPGPAVPH